MSRLTIIVVTFIAVVVLWAGSALAGSGGFRIFANDAEAIAKGGAFTGEADNPSAVEYNPAGLTQLEGNHVSFGAAVISPFVDHTSTSGDTTQMKRENFLVPHVFVTSDLGTERFAFGVGSTSNFGLSTEWAGDSFSRYVATRTDLENIDNHVTAAYQVNDKLSLGVGAIIEISNFNKEKNINQQPDAEGFAQLKGDDTTPGYTLSTLYKINPQHQIGLLYRSEIQHTYEGTATANNLGNSGSLPFNAIFGGSSYATPFEADLTLPQSAVLGYSYAPRDDWRFNFDVEWMDWSSIESEHLTFTEETNATRLAILEGLTASNRDWDSSVSFSAGAEHSLTEKLKIRGGYFFNPNVIPEANFDTTVTGAKCNGINLGFGYLLKEDLNLDMAWTGLFYEERIVDNAIGNASGASLDGTYKNFINIVTATVSYKFN